MEARPANLVNSLYFWSASVSKMIKETTNIVDDSHLCVECGIDIVHGEDLSLDGIFLDMLY